MFLLLPFLKPVYYIFMTYSCTSTTHLRPLWNLEPQCLISLCIAMPYPNPSISIHIHRHIHIYIYISFISIKSYLSNHVHIHRQIRQYPSYPWFPSYQYINEYIYIHINIYIYIYIYLSCPAFCSALGLFASGGLALDLGFRLVFKLGDQSTQAQCDTPSDKTYKKTYSKEIGKQSSELQTHVGHFATWWLRKWWPREVVT